MHTTSFNPMEPEITVPSRKRWTYSPFWYGFAGRAVLLSFCSGDSQQGDSLRPPSLSCRKNCFKRLQRTELDHGHRDRTDR